MYTTGEVAKICHVSKRTVQYYDHEHIVQPSRIHSNGKREYSKEDLQKFQLVLLYKDLGFSLKEIKVIFQENRQYLTLENMLFQKINNIEEQIENLTDQKEKISILMKEVKDQQRLTVFNHHELQNLLQYKKYTKLTYLLLVFYILILILTLIISSITHHVYIGWFIVMDVILLFLLVWFHAYQNAYICSYCHRKFIISFYKDLLSFHNGKKGKYLKCPYCHRKGWMMETYKDKIV